LGENVVYIDGEYFKKSDAKISVYDHGMLYGDGVFEGIRVYEKNVFKLVEHIDRLFASAKAIKLEMPVSKKEMIQIVVETCSKNNIVDGYVRLIVTRGVGDLGLDPVKCPKPSIICIAASIVLYPEEMYKKGLPIITASQRRNKFTIVDPQIKSLNYLNNIFAKMEATRAGVQEALMLNEEGIVAECTGDNIFYVKNGELVTPPIHVGILNGITRQTVINLAKKENISVTEKEFTLFNLYNADECFLTGSAAEIVAVVKVDERIISDGKPGPITNKLLSLFRECTKIEGVKIP
jgi:branched-chain amino acid aminotransferase